ncbi:MAG: hypothetical protein ACLGIV_02470 [Actinomycetes bacterium]
MRRKLTTLAAAGALGVAGVTGVALAGAALAPASAATAESTDADDPSWLEGRVERIADALQGLVSDGTLTQDQVDAVAETLAEEAPFAHHGPGMHGLGRALDTAAETLGVTTDELRDALRDGQTLAEVAEAQGVEVDALVDALVAAAQERLDEAVSDGRITQERADEIAGTLEERIAQHVEQGVPTRGDGLGRGGHHGGTDSGGMMGGADA